MTNRKYVSWHLIFILIICLMCCGCKTTEYIPVETVRVDTTYISKEKWDSIYVLDSVFIHEKGDTLLVEKTKYKYIERLAYDTIYKERTDSIQVPYPVEKKLSWWQGTCIKFFPWALLAIVSLLAYIFRKPILSLFKL